MTGVNDRNCAAITRLVSVRMLVTRKRVRDFDPFKSMHQLGRIDGAD